MSRSHDPQVVIIARHPDGRLITTVVEDPDPAARNEVQRLIAQADWEYVDITTALTPGMLRKIAEGKAEP